MFGPRGIAINSKGLIYVTDTGNKYIRVFNSNLEPLSSFGGEGSLPGKFNEPVGIAIDSSDNIYVADTGNSRIQKFNSEGKYLEEYPTRKPLPKDFFSMQPYLEVFSDGRIVWTASSYGEFWVLNIISKKYSVFKIDKNKISKPIGVTIDNKDNLWLSDKSIGIIYFINRKVLK